MTRETVLDAGVHWASVQKCVAVVDPTHHDTVIGNTERLEVGEVCVNSCYVDVGD